MTIATRIEYCEAQLAEARGEIATDLELLARSIRDGFSMEGLEEELPTIAGDISKASEIELKMQLLMSIENDD